MDINTTLAILGVVLGLIGAQSYLKNYFWYFIRFRSTNGVNYLNSELEKYTSLRNDAVLFNVFGFSQLFKFLTLFLFIFLLYGIETKGELLFAKIMIIEVLFFLIGIVVGDSFAVFKRVRNFTQTENKILAKIEKYEQKIVEANNSLNDES